MTWHTYVHGMCYMCYHWFQGAASYLPLVNTLIGLCMHGTVHRKHYVTQKLVAVIIGYR